MSRRIVSVIAVVGLGLVFSMLFSFERDRDVFGSSSSAESTVASGFPLVGKVAVLKSVSPASGSDILYTDNNFWIWHFAPTGVLTTAHLIYGNAGTDFSFDFIVDEVAGQVTIFEPDGIAYTKYTWTEDAPLVGQVSLHLVGAPASEVYSAVANGIVRKDAAGNILESYPEPAATMEQVSTLVFEFE